MENNDELNPTAIFLNTVKDRLEHANERIAKFRTDLDANVPYAMEWADGAFKSAGYISVYGEIYRVLTAEGTKATFANVREHALRELQRKARHRSRSTSGCSNMMEDTVLSAWAQLLEDADNAIHQVEARKRHQEREAQKVPCKNCGHRMMPEELKKHYLPMEPGQRTPKRCGAKGGAT